MIKPHAPEHIAYRPDIDGLRALAVIAVLIFHAFPSALPRGFIGVDIFFVISGYLIAGNILRDLKNDQFSMVQFYRRRIARLFPALFLVISTTLIAGSIFFTPLEYLQLSKHAFWGSVGFANISLWSEVGYFDKSAILKPLLHLWSLGVEEQFYLVVPLLLFILFKSGKHLVKFLIGFFLISFLLHLNPLGSFSKESLFFLPFFRAWELLAGVILACLVEQGTYKIENISPRKRDIMSIAGFIFILIGIITLSDKNLSPFGFLFPVIGTSLLIATGSHAYINRKIFSHKIAIGIGLISYPLYLWHWPLLSFLHILDQENSAVARGIILIVAFVLSYLTYRLFEKPVRHRARYSYRVALSLVVAMVGVMTLAQIVSLRDGHVGWASTLGNIDQSFSFPKPNDPACIEKFWGDTIPEGILVICSNSDPKGNDKPEIALIGDSHARHLFTGVEAYYQQKKKDVISWSAVGCYIFDSYPDNSACSDNYKQIFDKFERYKSIKTVIIGSYVPYMKSQNPEYIANMNSLVTRLTNQGKKVVIMIDIPQLDFGPRDCLERPLQFWQTRKDNCTIERSVYDNNIKEYRPQVYAATKGIKNVTVVDLPSILCDAKACKVREGENFLYRDTNHLSEFGSVYVSKFYKF